MQVDLVGSALDEIKTIVKRGVAENPLIIQNSNDDVVAELTTMDGNIVKAKDLLGKIHPLLDALIQPDVANISQLTQDIHDKFDLTYPLIQSIDAARQRYLDAIETVRKAVNDCGIQINNTCSAVEDDRVQNELNGTTLTDMGKNIANMLAEITNIHTELKSLSTASNQQIYDLLKGMVDVWSAQKDDIHQMHLNISNLYADMHQYVGQNLIDVQTISKNLEDLFPRADIYFPTTSKWINNRFLPVLNCAWHPDNTRLEATSSHHGVDGDEKSVYRV